MAAVLGVSKDAMHRVVKESELKPHRLESYMASNDPEFEARRRTSSVFIYIHPNMTPCSALTKRQPFKHWIV